MIHCQPPDQAQTGLTIIAQEEAQEYVQEGKLRDLVSQYSEFINFPIHLLTTKEVCPPPTGAALCSTHLA